MPLRGQTTIDERVGASLRAAIGLVSKTQFAAGDRGSHFPFPLKRL